MIRGYFDNRGRPRLICRVRMPRFGISREIHFLVDTGANKTTILPADGKRLGLPYDRLRGSISTYGIGGSSQHFWERVILGFDNDGDSSLRIVDVGIMPYNDEYHRLALPSLLGRDVLNNWDILYSPPRNRLECTVI